MRAFLLLVIFLYVIGPNPTLQAESQRPYRNIEKRYHVMEAYRTIKSIDYLPFSYIRDGCFARALYVGMELTSKKIPANNQYIIGKLIPEGARWGWHVAPVVHGPNNKPYIIDPAFADKPLTRKKWVSLSNPKKKPELLIAPITNYRKKQAKIGQQKQIPGYDYHNRITEFTEIPEFRLKDIANACSVAYKYIGEEDLTARQIKNKRRKLISRTKTLIKRLKRIGKIKSNDIIRSCKNQVIIAGK
ncbi:MAG: hypothetical protein HRU19_17295 [Pseudobacteriovorax sp.]|nr:hypothetical protein [Pseudobacteriovorax sp.]